METINLKGTVKRNDYLTKPVYFDSHSSYKTRKQFSNREIEVEYNYDINFQVNRNISDEEFVEMQNVLKSVFVCYGDRACNALFLWEIMMYSHTKLSEFMHAGDISVNYLSKRYILGTRNEIFFSSDYEVFIDNTTEEQKTI